MKGTIALPELIVRSADYLILILPPHRHVLKPRWIIFCSCPVSDPKATIFVHDDVLEVEILICQNEQFGIVE
jgi:hypothetical protein